MAGLGIGNAFTLEGTVGFVYNARNLRFGGSGSGFSFGVSCSRIGSGSFTTFGEGRAVC